MHIHQKIQFSKIHGAGNDFVFIDNRSKLFKEEKEIIESLCARRFGIGADGLILLEEHSDCHFSMRYFNADGNEASMCGNGGRSIMVFAYHLGLVPINEGIRFMAVDGIHEARIISQQNNNFLVALRMKDCPYPSKSGEDFVLDTGSPHYIRFQESDEQFVDHAKQIRNQAEFKEKGINVNFVEAIDKGIKIRTYERGVEDETLSCGTGATAAALAYATQNNLNQGRIAVQSRGGLLHISFIKNDPLQSYTDIWLEGPVQYVFDGKITSGL